MYVIVVYDMEADRTHLMLKLCRRYLVHVQNSVLEGEISEGDLATLKGRLKISFRRENQSWSTNSLRPVIEPYRVRRRPDRR